MKKLLILLLFCVSWQLRAQVVPADTVPAIVNYTEENGAIRFAAQRGIPPPRPLLVLVDLRGTTNRVAT